MLSYTDLTKGTMFIMDGDPYIVMEYAFIRMQQRKPNVQTKIKNLKTGKVVARTFQQTESFHEAEIEKEPIVFIYESKGEYWFHKVKDKGARFSLSGDILGDAAKFLKPNLEVAAHMFENDIIAIEPPIKLDYIVKEAPPSFKGDTSGGGGKVVILENGLSLTVPMFINEGDVIRVNTQSGEYAERAEKN